MTWPGERTRTCLSTSYHKVQSRSRSPPTSKTGRHADMGYEVFVCLFVCLYVCLFVFSMLAYLYICCCWCLHLFSCLYPHKLASCPGHLSYLGCLSRFCYIVRERRECSDIIPTHWVYKTICGLHPVPKCESSIYQPTGRCLNHCFIGASLCGEEWY